MNNELNMRLMEAGTMPLLGGILCGISEPVGHFYAAGLFSFGFRYVIDCATVGRRKAAARNARIEMEAMQAYFEEEGRRHR
jgi:hypothetical protein